MRGIIAGVVLTIAGPFITWNGYSHERLLKRLETEGTTVNAALESGEERSGRRGSRSYTLELSYQAGERSIVKKMPVTGSFFKSIATDESFLVETVPVKYLNSDPEQAIVVGGTPDKSWEKWLGIGFVVGGVGLGAFSFITARREQ